MDGSRFDAWTRRGFGTAAGGLAGALLAQAALPVAKAGKKKKKKCGKLNDQCNSGKKKCCCGYECQPQDSNGNRCCRAADFPASSDQECCSGRRELGRCICKTLFQACTSSEQCCSGFCDTAGSDQCEQPPPA